MADAAVRLKPLTHVAKIHGTMMLVDLDGIAAAKRNVRATRPGQMNEVPHPADATARARIAGGDFRPLIQPQIVGQ